MKNDPPRLAMLDTKLVGRPNAEATIEVLRQVIDLFPYEVFAKDSSGNFILSNVAHARNYGLAPSDLVGRNELELSPDTVEAQRFLDDDQEIIRTGQARFIPDEVYTDPSGKVISLQTTKIPLSLRGGDEIGVLGIAVDVSERKAAELTAKALSEKLGLAVRTAELGIWAHDEGTGKLRWNEEMYRIYGMDPFGPPPAFEQWANCLHPDDRQRVESEFETLLLQPVSRINFRIIRPDGTVRHLLASGDVLHESDGRIRERYGINIDITEHVLREEEFRIKDRQLLEKRRLESLGLLAGGIAHDFNNLLQSIRLQADIAEQTTDAAVRIKSLNVIDRTCEKAAALCKQLLSYAGKRQMTLERIEPRAFLEDNQELFDLSRARGVRIEFHIANDLPLVIADETQLRQILVNLIVNAVEAVESKAEGTIDVLCETVTHAPQGRVHYSWSGEERELVAFTVVDNGEGISDEALNRVFEPYFTTKAEGHGFGLSTILGIVQAHQGAICVDRGPGGVGTKFTICLPAARKVIDRAPQQRSQSNRLDDETVLIVDDEEIVVESLKVLLQVSGAKVLSARTGEDALELLREHCTEVTVAIVDITMPGISGVELADAMGQVSPKLKVIISSGYAGALSKSSRVSNYPLLAKPYSFEELLAAIHDPIEHDVAMLSKATFRDSAAEEADMSQSDTSA